MRTRWLGRPAWTWVGSVLVTLAFAVGLAFSDVPATRVVCGGLILVRLGEMTNWFVRGRRERTSRLSADRTSSDGVVPPR